MAIFYIYEKIFNYIEVLINKHIDSVISNGLWHWQQICLLGLYL